MYNVFKEIPQRQIKWTYLKTTTLVLDGPRNVAHNLIAPDKTLGIRIVKSLLFQIIGANEKPSCFHLS
jgi:L-threonylcarbamoyladenylate synthase